jgi:signal transduction histidine kinase
VKVALMQQLAEAGIELAREASVDACAQQLITIVKEYELAQNAAFVGGTTIARLAQGDLRLIPEHHDSVRYPATVEAGAVVTRRGDWSAVAITEPGEPSDGWSALLWTNASDDDLPAVRMLARQAGLALGLVRERDQQASRQRQQAALVEAGKALAQELHLDSVLERIVHLASHLVGARYGALGVLDETGTKLNRFVTTGLTDEQHEQIGDLPSGRGILGLVIRESRVVRMRDLTAHPDAVGFPEHHPPMHSFLGVPIMTRRQVAGRIYLTEKIGGNEFTADDEAIALTLASQAAIAIENAALYEDLERTNRELAEASRHKSVFLANMSHELRSPLNTIIGYASLLLDEPGSLNSEQLEDLRIIQASSKHLLTLIADLLDLSKIEAGRLELHPSRMDVAALMREAVAALQPQVHDGVTLSGVAPETLLMMGDRGRIRQMLLNVIGNAVKFTRDGEVVARVHDDQDHVIIEVSDTGPGIPPTDIDRIFDSFFQSAAAQARTPREHEGAGLGLAITKALADRHGGAVSLASHDGQGTTVTIMLPITGPPEDNEITGRSEGDDA